MKPVESKEKKETLYFFSWKCTGFIGFARLLCGFITVSLRFHAVSHARWQNGIVSSCAADAAAERRADNQNPAPSAPHLRPSSYYALALRTGASPNKCYSDILAAGRSRAEGVPCQHQTPGKHQGNRAHRRNLGDRTRKRKLTKASPDDKPKARKANPRSMHL